MTLAVERAGSEHGADRLDQRRIRHRSDRARAPRRLSPRRAAVPVDGGAGRTPDPAHTGHAVGPAAAGRDGAAHGLDLRRPKGTVPRASRAAILASSSSRPISISPSRALSRSLARSSPSAGRLTRLASPAARKASRQVVSVAAVTPNARETVSRSSPPSRRNTAAVFRCRDIRPPRPGAAAPDPCGRSVAPGRSANLSVIVHPSGGYRPPTGCLTQPWCRGDAGVADPLSPPRAQPREPRQDVGRPDPSCRSEEHTSELQSRQYLVCRLLLEKK